MNETKMFTFYYEVYMYTELQKFIIRYISNEFCNPEKLKLIADEYKAIFSSDLKEDYKKFEDHINSILYGKEWKDRFREDKL